MKILILEDEIPAYQKLLSFVQFEIPNHQLIGWARSVEEAKLLLSGGQTPDLILSDIELLDGNSFEVFENSTINCPIIFCTAFDKYVLKAFQTNGIAYLLKPYTLENFQEAFHKYSTLFAKDEPQNIDNQVFQELKNMLKQGKKSYKQRFTIKKKGGIKLIETKDIAYFEANGDFCQGIDTTGQKHVINFTLSDIENKIDPVSFFRINRSQLINISFIEKIEPYFKNRLSIKMTVGKDTLLTSGTKTPEFRKWIEG